jgi:hypothetical protein
MNSDEKDYIELFWIFFHPLETFAWSEGFNDANSAMPIFDQILNSHFNSVIYKEENVYGDGQLTIT